MSNYVSRSNTLQYDDVTGVILSEETHREASGGSTSGSALNAQSRGRTNERGNNFGNQEESQKGGGLNQEDQTIAGIVGNQGTKRKIVGFKRKMKEIN